MNSENKENLGLLLVFPGPLISNNSWKVQSIMVLKNSTVMEGVYFSLTNPPVNWNCVPTPTQKSYN